MVLSGGPESVYGEGLSRGAARDPYAAGRRCSESATGCSSSRAIAAVRFARPPRRSYGPAELDHTGEGRLFRGVPRRLRVWASHGDLVEALPAGFRRTAGHEAGPDRGLREPGPGAFTACSSTRRWSTPSTAPRFLRNFAFEVCGARGGWTPKAHAESAISAIREQVGPHRVVCGVSGGVDSTVTAALVHRAVGDRLHCILVDNGVLRKREAERVRSAFQDGMGIPLRVVDASGRFLARLAGGAEPGTEAQADRPGIHPGLRGRLPGDSGGAVPRAGGRSTPMSSRA